MARTESGTSKIMEWMPHRDLVVRIVLVLPNPSCWGAQSSSELALGQEVILRVPETLRGSELVDLLGAKLARDVDPVPSAPLILLVGERRLSMSRTLGDTWHNSS